MQSLRTNRWVQYAALGLAVTLFALVLSSALLALVWDEPRDGYWIAVGLLAFGLGLSYVVGVILARRIWDTAEHRRQEIEELRESMNGADRRVSETREKLARAERLAEIGGLAAGVAHELRNPLGSINNAAYYLNARLGDTELVEQNPRVGQIIGMLQSEVETANKIVTDLTDFSRVRPPDLSPTDISEVIESALDRTDMDPEITVTRSWDGSLPTIQTDADQMRRAFGNLIQNSIEAMPDGGTLEITASVKGDSIRVEFHDTGEGISEGDMDKIMDPLFTTKAKGVGMGLAVVKTIVERHQGEISVSSGARGGARFTLEIPIGR